MGEKVKLFLIAESQLINVGEIMELEIYLATPIIRIVSGKNYQWMLTLVGDEKQDTYRVSK